MNEFFSQGGYAGYVWGSYGLAVVLMALEIVFLRRERGTNLARIRRWIRLNKQGNAK